ncbi:uncharacterized protein LOC128389556 [Panonychus citri]|uniref:uncharacterized protein LOC128389556 n=1 Tax=Panonychus citri TaxID=50023 RepID=UPI00230752FC|nr:uncharacterized protein LOC128389556 [Panonychus citri]
MISVCCLGGRQSVRFRLPFRTIYCQRFLSSSIHDFNQFIHQYLDKPLRLTPNPQEYEEIWSTYWKVNNLSATRSSGNSSGQSFSLLFPPPNITGQLHLGHALTVALQDSFIRHQRMFSDADITFIPGFDHAGISTYLVLDKTVRKSMGKSISELSEDEFSAIFSSWKIDRIAGIKGQLDRLGSSLDYGKEYFTLDSNLSSAVNKAFSILHEKGLIYRSNLPVNWSYFMQSALSDLEVNFRPIEGGTKLSIPGYPDKVDFGLFHTVMYPVVDGNPGESISVSTMNIYTIPGDVAIIVHPEDSRYTKYHGKKVLNPITGQPIPIITDKHARIDFGTGAVKITPSSCFTDYELACKYNLPIENFMSPTGTLIEGTISPQFDQLYKCSHRYDLAREIINVLKGANLYAGCEKQATIVPFCKRSEDVIEHRIMPQWFLNVKPGYDMLRDHIDNQSFKIFPPKKVKLLTEWFDKKRDWCLSRQIPFGHRIPAWSVSPSEGSTIWFIGTNKEEAFLKASQHFGTNEIDLKQDNDVLDTWFSSALLPLSALGWPDKESLYFQKFYPLTLMETGFDIITFWVMKMALLSLYLTGQLPFPKVHLHGMVCDGKGRKMSKSKGNVINPIDVIDGTTLKSLQSESKKLYQQGILNQEEYENALTTQESLFPKGIAPCGSDGLRFSLYEYNATSEKISFGVNYLESNRHMVNKIWQAFRFYLIHSEEKTSHGNLSIQVNSELDLVNYLDQMNPFDKWILGQFYLLIKDFHSNIENFTQSNIYRNFFEFWVKCFCDIYIEVIKPRNNLPIDPLSHAICGQLIRSTLIAMHPLIPFVTEELYQRFNKHQSSSSSKQFNLSSILNEKFPDVNYFSQFADPSLNHSMDVFREIGRILGNYKKTCNLDKEQFKSTRITICSNELNDGQLIDALKRIRAVENITLVNHLDQQLLETSITLRATLNSFVCFPYEQEHANQILQFLEKSINRLLIMILRERKYEKRVNAAEYLERVMFDQNQLINLIATKKT